VYDLEIDMTAVFSTIIL